MSTTTRASWSSSVASAICFSSASLETWLSGTRSPLRARLDLAEQVEEEKGEDERGDDQDGVERVLGEPAADRAETLADRPGDVAAVHLRWAHR